MGLAIAQSPDAPSEASNPGSATWRLWIDGTAAPNPGPLGLGIVLESSGGEQHRMARRESYGCSNAAELKALIQGLSWAQQTGVRHIDIFSDSDFVVRHVGGEVRTRTAPLQALVAEARTLLLGFRIATLNWIPRHRNGEADALARSAVGLAPKPAKRPVSKKRRR